MTKFLGVDPDQGKDAADEKQKDTPGEDRGLGSPSSYQEQQLAALAYPSHTILASQLKGERNFFLTHVSTRAPKASGTAWQLVGPTTVTQPGFLNFFNQYLANGGESNDFQVSGRITAIAVDTNDCNEQTCRIWVAAAGGGIWRNDNALDSSSQWTYVSGGFGTNAIGTLAYNANTGALYAGTGEPNASGDSESGVGIYVSRDLGDHWKLLPGSPDATYARAVSSIAFDPDHPNTLYVGTTRAVRGVSGVTGGAVSLAPDAPAWGLWKSSNNGQSFSFMWDGNGSPRGVNHVEVDAAHHTVYAAAFRQGIWRSSNGGSTWEQVFATKDAGDNNARTEFALNYTNPGNHTRIYVGDGGIETGGGAPPPSNTGVYRADSLDTTPAASLVTGGTDAGYTSLTSNGTTPTGRRDPHFPTHDYCTGQCWYDNFVVSPAGHPDNVYVGGSFDYNFYPFWGGRAVLLSQDAGATWTEQTTSADMQVGIHPDQHALATDPANPLLFFEGSDGGIVRSSGQVVDDGASFCAAINPASSFSTACLNMHKAVPTSLFTINDGLSTLQFQNIVVNPNDPSQLMGGTQDNGTWLGPNDTSQWNQTIYGDGGVAAFDAPGGDPNFELNEFFDRYTDVNESGGDPTKWAVASGPFFASKEASEFYKPQIGDTTTPGTFFVGLQSVWRTQDYGGHPSTDPGPNVGGTGCSEFTTPGDDPNCGDFVALGGPPAGGPGSASDLTAASLGSRSGGLVAALARGHDSGTLWVATSTGRVFISDNADAADSSSVTFIRLDSLASNDPGRFVTGITVNPDNPDEAWISYDGYNANTPDQPGHVFRVDYDSGAGTATWTNLDGNTGPLTDQLGDLPVTDVVRDDSTGTLYASTDFGVLSSSGDGTWAPLGSGMPQVEVPWLTIDPSSDTLYAATHGRGIWSFSLSG